MKESIEDLLKPRYKVIADWPGATVKVGDVISYNEFDVHVVLAGREPYLISDYPHLFKRLEWWEERSEDEMAEYVKTDGIVFKVEQYEHLGYDDAVAWFVKGSTYAGSCLRASVLPATQAEYESFINQK